MTFPRKVKFDEHGLIPAIIQDASSGEVLMLAYMNKEALQRTLKTRKTHFYSRSRRKLWLKGESSGHIQSVRSIFYDCDWDTLLLKVSQKGGACHEGYRSCFFRRAKGTKVQIVGRKVFDPRKVYGT
ncbi:MAG: phosphoribosyl-AMP cyclohydrolase [Candidatus Omnitrophica bacterium]|nr:phosphoribosyl-AMP cyclohydrolase [Candidatus Omnitrophota bacterium]